MPSKSRIGTDGANCLTPPELAKRWGVDADKIRDWILRGELRAFNAATNTTGRPRFRIPSDAIVEFENRRSAYQPPAPPKRRSKDSGMIEYF